MNIPKSLIKEEININIMGLQGQKILNQKSVGLKTISIENLPQGLYLMTISKGDEIKFSDKIFCF
ncbi:MAG: T9SS type A sorting domain-containing protein [Saprospiraceae bacterium]|uniref:T9SS type A sorting domain-containing protein n=1 Tax=Candidatus Defluviibacterium haderslevense TaxID=2981993 RepID=A0A9D7XE60_9BACT|nr:T9SS type A sorting domain-containing protein [Candidatus Defluviibacterium haderslevense]